jgi:UDP-GlcNAc:undecaprenyl-phosphate GlcNAc-1-phosphate transferase
VAASLAAVLTPVSRWLSLRFGAVDLPDQRKVHRSSMPRMGGVAIVIAFIVPIAGLFVFNAEQARTWFAAGWQVEALIGGGLAIAILGAVDDIKGVKARQKFICQALVAVVAWFAGFQIRRLGLPFYGSIDLPAWFDLILTVVWITGIINAINLIDGLDGLAAGVTFIVAATNFILSVRADNELGALFAATIAGTVIGFLFFNWNPAIVFMGDTGSMFLGYILATTSIMTSQKVSTAVAMVVPIVALGVPVIDTLMSMVRRFLEKRPLFSPDKGHLHHRLLRAGLTQRRAVLTIYALCIVFAVAAIGMTAAKNMQTAVSLGVLFIVVIGIIRFFGFMNVTSTVRGLLRRNQLVEKLRPILPKFSADVVGQSKSIDDVWRALTELCEKFNCKEVSWRTAGIKPAEVRRAALLEKGTGAYKKASRKGFVSAKSSAHLSPHSYIEIRFVYPSGMNSDDAGIDIVFQLLADAIGVALKRLIRDEGWSPAVASLLPEQKNTIPEKGCLVEKTETDVGRLQKEVMDDIWDKFVGLCKDSGFCGAGWKTFGLEPVDERKELFEQSSEEIKDFLQHAVPITSLSFVHLRFYYKKLSKKKISQEYKKSSHTICAQIGSMFRGQYKRLAG